MSTKVEAPPPRNIQEEGRQTLAAQQELVPQSFALDSQYGPGYVDLFNQLQRRSIYGEPNWAEYAQDPRVAAGYQNAIASGEQWESPEAYAQNYYTNIGRVRGDQLPSAGGSLDLLRQVSPEYQNLQAQLNTQQRQADIADVAALGPQAMAAFNAANPELASLKSRLAQVAGGSGPVRDISAERVGDTFQISPYERVTAGPNISSQAYQYSALGELAKGGQLGAQESRDLTNQVLARFNRSGRAGDPGAIANVALNLDQAQQNRLSQRQAAVAQGANLQQAQNLAALQAAMANQGAGLQQQGLGAQIALSDAQRALQAAMANQGADLSNAQYLAQATGLLGGLQQDPFQAILGRSGGLGTAMQGIGQSTGALGYQGSGMFNPFSPYGQDIYSSNQNMLYSTNAANAQGANSLLGAGIAGAGALGGGLLAGAGAAGSFGALFACWVAREVYGAENPKWKGFRHWLFKKAPLWFYKAYLRHGEKVAAFIKEHAYLKPIIRLWMDSRIQEVRHGV